MEISDKWLFNVNELECNPNRVDKISERDEMKLRYNSASFIQDLGEALGLDQLSINTGIVYMHRFYTMQSFLKFPYQTMASACLMVSARILYQYRMVEAVAKKAFMLTHKQMGQGLARDKEIRELMEDIVIDEEILLSTLGFDTSVDLPHSFVVNACSSDSVPKEIAHYAYLIASASLFTTMMCIKFTPTTLACVCILTAKKWTRIEKAAFSEEQHWFKKIDENLTQEKLEELSDELMSSLTTYPTKFMRKLTAKPTLNDGRIEVINRPHSGMTSSLKTIPQTSNQKRLSHSGVQMTEQRNGNPSLKICDKRPTTPANGLKTTPSRHTTHHPRHSMPRVNDKNPLKQPQLVKPKIEVPLNMKSGFALPLQSEIRPENKMHVPHPVHSETQNLKVGPPPLPSFNSSLETKTSPRNTYPLATISSARPAHPPIYPAAEKSILPKEPIPSVEVQPLHTLDQVDFTSCEVLKDSSKKKHKKDKSERSEKKHKKKSKREREPVEETRKIAPIRIKLPPLIPRIVDTQEPSMDVLPGNNPGGLPPIDISKEPLKVKINMDQQGNFCHQMPYIIPMHQSAPASEAPKKRKHAEDLRISSKKSHRHEDCYNPSSKFPPLSSDPASSLMPSKV